MRRTLQEHLQFAVQNTQNQLAQAVVLKEMLHYDILRALAASELGDRLVFQGGTALRICHNGNRLSEDLDFVAGAGEVEPLVLDEMATILQEQMSDRYGLTFDRIKEPKNALQAGSVAVKRWSFDIQVQALGTTSKIHFEVCNVPAHDAVPMVLRPVYRQLESIEPFTLKVESAEEIYADKLVALGLRKFVKARDCWDLSFLSNRGYSANYDLVLQKLKDYQQTPEAYLAGLAQAQERLADPATIKAFVDEMSRFVDAGMQRALSQNPDSARAYLEHAAREATQIRQWLEQGQAQDMQEDYDTGPSM
ncbi:TPA: nucleotidyl transferase AbiEii/AbiGii toxin family protein [Pseudomonas aeruginosa]|nr:nucleotidyl transferase AbiEii/AbiGii toxin family protein [Pseudomonas aeruginosa]HCF3602490.1 nucleotidyl transferase AbiEii/AbiGii toxin family protein [Pseudomonas aeruginosa]